MAEYKEKHIDEMTVEDAITIAHDKATCHDHSCRDCLSDTVYWYGADGCTSVMEKAAEKLLEELDGTNAVPEQQIVIHPPEYEGTISLMRSMGYSRCYMCGSELGKE